jgi:uncharacterized membrane protein
MYSRKTVSCALLLGVVITLITGVVNTTPGILGALWYGWPMSWLKRLVIAPQYNPWRVTFGSLFIDIVFWFIVCWIILFAFCQTCRKHAPATDAHRRRRR